MKTMITIEKANERIRTALSRANIRHWQLADALGMAESTLCKKLRKELPPAEQRYILSVIKKMKERANK